MPFPRPHSSVNMIFFQKKTFLLCCLWIFHVFSKILDVFQGYTEMFSYSPKQALKKTLSIYPGKNYTELKHSYKNPGKQHYLVNSFITRTTSLIKQEFSIPVLQNCNNSRCLQTSCVFWCGGYLNILKI